MEDSISGNPSLKSSRGAKLKFKLKVKKTNRGDNKPRQDQKSGLLRNKKKKWSANP